MFTPRYDESVPQAAAPGPGGASPDAPAATESAASLLPLFRPTAVAVVGASRDESSIGRRVLDAIRAFGYTGVVYPVNPRAREIAGIRAYPSPRELPGAADLAVLVVPRDAVLAAVETALPRG